MTRLASAALLAISLTHFLSIAPAAAAEVPGAGAGGQQCGPTEFMDALGQRESTNNYQAVNDYGYLGRYQMGADALVEAGYALKGSTNKNILWTGKDGITSNSQFLNSEEAQDKAYRLYAKDNWEQIQSFGWDKKYIGTTLPNGQVVTESSLLFGSHLGTGNLQQYLQTGSCGNASDANGTCVQEYMELGTGYDISDIIGQDASANSCGVPPSEADEKYEGDTTSKTCIPTVPMLQSIDCSKYPSSLQGFCYRYKPLQMNMSMCQAAERWAENVPPSGPQLENCKTQTFRDGTSSWSYVHGCAKARPAPGEKGLDNDRQRVVADASDPACYDRLRAKGVEFHEQGTYDASTGGLTCIIQNSLVYGGKAVPFGKQLQMSCALAERLEEFGEIMSGKGVTGYTDVGTVYCRLMNTGGGKSNGVVSYHGTGEAIDIGGFMLGGRKLHGSEHFTNPTSRAWLEDMKQVGCSVFDRVLAWTYYKGTGESHIHLEVGHGGSCDPVKK